MPASIEIPGFLLLIIVPAVTFLIVIIVDWYTTSTTLEETQDALERSRANLKSEKEWSARLQDKLVTAEVALMESKRVVKSPPVKRIKKTTT